MSTDALRRASDALAAVARSGDGVDVIVSSLLAGLDGDDTKARISAAWATCIVAEAAPDTLGPLTHGLVERLVDAPEDVFLTRTLVTIHEEEPEVVKEALAAIAGDQAPSLYRRVTAAEPWDIDDVVAADDGGPDVPARQLVRADGTTAPPPEAAPGQTDSPAGDGKEARASGQTPSNAPTPAGRDSTRDGAAVEDEPDEATPDSEVRARRERIRDVEESKVFASLDYHSDFEDLSVVSPRRERRYADVVRARATDDGEAFGVALRLFDDCDPEGAFSTTLTDHLESWADASDVTGVLTVYDWGDRPRPWAGTAYVDETLASLSARSPEAAFWDARVLTNALSELHNRGIVHAGLDPRNVVYPAEVVDGASRPLFDNVGLLLAFRERSDPAAYLDPRYAAPEYYSGKFGRVDHATDIYQLGAVLYRLFTGRHPFEGGFERVRRQVLAADPPKPTEVRPSLPDQLDAVVAKAMSKPKLTRYDSAVRFHREVVAVYEDSL